MFRKSNPSGLRQPLLPLFETETADGISTPGRLPFRLAATSLPPLKCQGIKTRLLGFLFHHLRWSGRGRWREPFLGSGVVLFNLRPRQALATDTNPHLIAFYRALQTGELSPSMVADYLATEGNLLRLRGEEHYLQVRDRFNRHPTPFDFLFLNRACFNGLIRFNRQWKFNVPFCQKPDRFSRSHITRICNQVAHAQQLLQTHDWELCHADWRACLRECQPEDFVYFDPPYSGRHADYYQKWTDEDAMELSRVMRGLDCGYALSMWHSDAFRENPALSFYASGLVMVGVSHFYHVGARENWRHAIREVLLIKPGCQFIDPAHAGAVFPTG